MHLTTAAPTRRSKASATPRSARLAAVATALPPHTVSQPQARAFVAEMFERVVRGDTSRLLAVFDRSGIVSRRTCMPLDWYRTPHDFGETSAAYVDQALILARDAAERALERSGYGAADVTHLLFVSSTGIATPSIDARLAAAAGFASHVRRVPIWGLGCAGAAAGLARAAEFARSDPNAVVLMIALELCTLAFQPGDSDARNIVATALFSDGAAAAVVTAPGRRPPRNAEGTGGVALDVLASSSTLWPGTLDIMGWTVDAQGLHVVFSRDIPAFVRQCIRADIEEFLAAHGRTLADLDHFVAHPGGPKVIEAYADALAFEPARLRHSQAVLERCGNMSSPTCLFVLEATLAAGDVHAGDTALVAALGPGFASEYVLLQAADRVDPKA